MTNHMGISMVREESSDYDNFPKENDIKSPHDRLFKKLFSSPEMIVEFLEYSLDEKIFLKLDLQTLKREPSNLIASNLDEYYSDVLYEVEYAGQKIYLFLLLEHKSYFDKRVTFQLLDYIKEIMEVKFLTSDNIVPVIPFLFYHGRGSSGLVDLEEEFKYFDPALKKYLLTFKVIEVLAPSEEMKKSKFKLINFSALVFFLRETEDEYNWYIKVANEVEDLYLKGYSRFLDVVLQPVVEYILLISELEQSLVSGVLGEKYPGGEEIVSTTGEKLMRKGKMEGKKEELINTLTVQLQKKLQMDLPVDVKDEMKRADKRILEEIRDRIFDIESMDEVRDILK